MTTYRSRTMNEQFYDLELFPKNHILIKLLNDTSYRDKYFEDINPDEYNMRRLKKLQRIYSKAIKADMKHKNSLLGRLKDKFGDEQILSNDESFILASKSQIYDFEKKLSYMLFFDIITIEEAKKKGFSKEYIESLLNECKEIIENPYDKYYSYSNNKVKTKR